MYLRGSSATATPLRQRNPECHAGMTLAGAKFFSLKKNGLIRATRVLLHHQWECRMIHPLWKMVWHVLKKVNLISQQF